jgi:arginine N-succinyltransferase
MFIARPVELADIPMLSSLTAAAPFHVPTLPQATQAMQVAAERSLDAFAASIKKPGSESYLFVLENLDNRTIVGMATISATAQANGPFFSFRNDTIQQVSRDLNISHSVHALTFCSDLTDYSQLSGFYLPQDAVGNEAILLACARLMFAAVAPYRFAERFFASLAGVISANGQSPFWEAIGRKFFKMDYREAERIVHGTRNRTLIVEMMPHYPIYVPLLPQDAQAAMGRPHADSVLSYRILRDEGFETGEFIDIFDGGPVLRARKQALRAFNSSVQRRVMHSEKTYKANGVYLISNMFEQHFRATTISYEELEMLDSIALSSDLMACLQVSEGDPVLCVKLS